MNRLNNNLRILRKKGKSREFSIKESKVSTNFDDDIIQFLECHPSRDPKLDYITRREDLLGSGGYGEVYRTQNRISGERYAIKVVDLSVLSPREKELNLLETKFLSVLNNSQYILHIKECYYFQNKVYSILDLVKHGNLAEYITSETYYKYSEALTFKLFEQMVYALRDVHAQNIAHRDIKPDNFLIKTEISGIPKLLLSDFGLSSFMDQPLKDCIPSIHSAPEVLRDCVVSKKSLIKYDGRAADVYSLGVCLYMLYHGPAYPYEHSDDINTQLHIIKNSPIDFHEGIPVSLKKLILGMLDFSPVKRLTISQILDSEWFVKNAKLSMKLLKKSSDF